MCCASAVELLLLLLTGVAEELATVLGVEGSVAAAAEEEAVLEEA